MGLAIHSLLLNLLLLSVQASGRHWALHDLEELAYRIVELFLSRGMSLDKHLFLNCGGFTLFVSTLTAERA